MKDRTKHPQPLPLIRPSEVPILRAAGRSGWRARPRFLSGADPEEGSPPGPAGETGKMVAFSATFGLGFRTVTITTTRSPADEILHVLLGTEEGRQDPYLLYRALRDIAPLFRSDL